MTHEDRARLREEHLINRTGCKCGSCPRWCEKCNSKWPCHVALLLDEVEEAEARSRIDQEQCDRMTKLAGELAVELKSEREKSAKLAEALRDAIGQVTSARKGSIGSIGSHYLPQVRVVDAESWIETLREAQASEDGRA